MTSKTPQFRADQLVHGYRNGHRALAGSIEVDDRIAATMLGLSDLLTESTGDDSYLVGYPLKDINRYVLARTWPAFEMPRPGCVWTHSLLIDYASLARIPDPTVLTRLHQRPSADTLGTFNSEVKFSPVRGGRGRDAADPRATTALTALYAADGHALLAASSSESDENLALALWRQMWSRMRRSFFFCTSTLAPITGIDAECSLQILVGDDAPRFVKEPPIEGTRFRGVAILDDDLPEQRETDLRRFLGRYAPDLPDHRIAAPRLAAIYADLSKARTDEELEAAVAGMSLLLPAIQGRLLKSDLLLGRFRAPEVSGRMAGRDFAKGVTGLALQPSPLPDEALRERISELHGLGQFHDEEIVRATVSAPEGTLGAVSLRLYLDLFPDIAASLPDDDGSKLALAKIKPDLLQRPSFWNVAPEQRSTLIDMALSQGLDPLDLMRALTPTITADEIWRLAAVGGGPAVRLLLSSLESGSPLSDTLEE